MVQQVIGVGAVANDGTGDPARTAFQKTNANFNELYTPLVRTASEIAAGVTPTNPNWRPYDVRRYGYVGDATADDTISIINAQLALNGRGIVVFPPYITAAKVTSQIIIPRGVTWSGAGFSELFGTGPSNRGATCILRAFTGSNATVLASGDDIIISGIDIDNNLQGTGECLQVTGSRAALDQVSCRNSGGDGLRIGKTDSGASTINANNWKAIHIVVAGNMGAGMRLDDTNTTTSLTYPLGVSNVNAGQCLVLDARNNGSDGLQIGNANDNIFNTVASQSNTGCGIRFKTDGVNSGPRCNKILGNDCENNTGNDIQIDAATLPLSGPGLYNVIFGNRSVAVSSRIVDNSTGSLVIQWLPNLGFRAYHFGSDVNALATSGVVGLNLYVGANNSPARLYGLASGAVDSILRGSVHKAGGSQTDGFELNQNAVFRPLNDLFTLAYSASITIDASTGMWFEVTASNGTSFTFNAPTNPQTGQEITVTVRNTSGGVLGAVTWNAIFKLAAWVSPANGNSRSIKFRYDSASWVESSRTPADVPN
jgi:hypothetical protein